MSATISQRNPRGGKSGEGGGWWWRWWLEDHLSTCKWFATPIYKQWKGHLEREQPYLGRWLVVVLTWWWRWWWRGGGFDVVTCETQHWAMRHLHGAAFPRWLGGKLKISYQTSRRFLCQTAWVPNWTKTSWLLLKLCRFWLLSCKSLTCQSGFGTFRELFIDLIQVRIDLIQVWPFKIRMISIESTHVLKFWTTKTRTFSEFLFWVARYLHTGDLCERCDCCWCYAREVWWLFHAMGRTHGGPSTSPDEPRWAQKTQF